MLTALAKLPADRFATAAQFAEALVASSFGTAAVAHAVTVTWLQRNAVPVVAVLSILALAASAVAIRVAMKSSPAAVSRFALSVPTSAKLVTAGGTLVAWAPDGRAIVYVGAGPGGAQLWQRSLDAITPTPIAGTDGASSPIVSPDGSQVGYLTVNPFSMQVVPRAGGRPTTVVTGARVSGGGASWASDGFIYFDGGTGLSRIRPDGTGVEVISPLDTARQEVGVAWPEALPGGRGILFRLRHNGEDSDKYSIVVLDLKTRKRTTLVNGLVARYAPTGHLLFVTADGALMAQRFDLDKLELRGTPVQLVHGLGLGGFGSADVAISSTGTPRRKRLLTAEPDFRHAIYNSHAIPSGSLNATYSFPSVASVFTPVFSIPMELSASATRQWPSRRGRSPARSRTDRQGCAHSFILAFSSVSQFSATVTVVALPASPRRARAIMKRPSAATSHGV